MGVGESSPSASGVFRVKSAEEEAIACAYAAPNDDERLRKEGPLLELEHGGDTWELKWVVLTPYNLACFATDGGRPAVGQRPHKMLTCAMLADSARPMVAALPTSGDHAKLAAATSLPAFMVAATDGSCSLTLAVPSGDDAECAAWVAAIAQVASAAGGGAVSAADEAWSSQSATAASAANTATTIEATRAAARPRAVTHRMAYHFFLRPEWCDACGGVLVGSGFKCAGDCGAMAHYMEGDGTHDNCHAEALAWRCDADAMASRRADARAARHAERGTTRDFQWGLQDYRKAAEQLGKNIHGRVKDSVVKAAVEEQRGKGRLQKLRQRVQSLRESYDGQRVAAMLFASIAAFAGLSALIAGATTRLALVASLAPFDELADLVSLQATSAALVSMIFSTVLLGGAAFAASVVEEKAELVHAFAAEIVHVHLEELLIDVGSTAVAVGSLARRVLSWALVSDAIASAVWVVMLARNARQ